MAVEVITPIPAVIESSSTGQVTTSITVPADAEAIVVMAVGFSSTASNLWPGDAAMTFAGNNLTLERGSAYNDDLPEITGMSGTSGHICIWVGTENSWGSSEDLVYDWGAGIAEGVATQVVFVKGIDSSSLVKDKDLSALNGDISGLTTAADDLTIGCAYTYNSAPTVTDNSQTELRSDTYNTAGYGMAYKANSSTFDMSNTSYSICCAVVLTAGDANVTDAVPAGTLSIVGYAPLDHQTVIDRVPAGVLSIVGYAPTDGLAGQTVTDAIDSGVLEIVGYAPSDWQHVIDRPEAGQIGITGYAPTDRSTGH